MTAAPSSMAKPGLSPLSPRVSGDGQTTDAGQENYTVGDYLADRLVEAGVDHVFGVPGDYTLALLDHIVDHAGLSWTGCTNELNAGYAADGYARLRGIGALITTFGVGELSAINALAGSFAEHVPVVHIVGSPATGTQAAQRVVHHSLGDGVFSHFIDMHEPITCCRAALSADNAGTEIDRVLATVLSQRLPGYILLPADVATSSMVPPTRPLVVPRSASDPDSLAGFTSAARQLIGTATEVGDVRVLAGLLAHRLGAVRQVRELLDAGPLFHATSLWGKSLVDESAPTFAGVYAGAASSETVRHVVEDAPVLVLAGVQFTDLNSGFFTQQIKRTRTIEIGPNTASVGVAVFSPVTLADALEATTRIVKELAGKSRSGRLLRSSTARNRCPQREPVPRPEPERLVGPHCRFLPPRRRRAGRPGVLFLWSRHAPLAQGRRFHRPAPVGVDRLHIARAPRRLPGRPRAPRGLAYRGRRRPNDGPGDLDPFQGRPLPYHFPGRQWRLYGRAGHPWA